MSILKKMANLRPEIVQSVETALLTTPRATLVEIHVACLRATLARCGGNVTATARTLDTDRVTLRRHLVAAGICQPGVAPTHTTLATRVAELEAEVARLRAGATA